MVSFWHLLAVLRTVEMNANIKRLRGFNFTRLEVTSDIYYEHFRWIMFIVLPNKQKILTHEREKIFPNELWP